LQRGISYLLVVIAQTVFPEHVEPFTVESQQPMTFFELVNVVVFAGQVITSADTTLSKPSLTEQFFGIETTIIIVIRIAKAAANKVNRGFIYQLIVDVFMF
jgi:hypothetical protein